MRYIGYITRVEKKKGSRPSYKISIMFMYEKCIKREIERYSKLENFTS